MNVCFMKADPGKIVGSCLSSQPIQSERMGRGAGLPLGLNRPGREVNMKYGMRAIPGLQLPEKARTAIMKCFYQETQRGEYNEEMDDIYYGAVHHGITFGR